MFMLVIILATFCLKKHNLEIIPTVIRVMGFGHICVGVYFSSMVSRKGCGVVVARLLESALFMFLLAFIS